MHLLEISDSYPESYWLEYDNNLNPDHMAFKCCVALDLPSGRQITFKANKKVRPEKLLSFDYLFSNGPDLISDRLSDLLAEQVSDSEIQIFPAIIFKDDKRISGFNVVNYLKCEPAIDLASSIHKPLLSTMPSGPRKFLHTVLLEIDPSFKIFRAAENMEEIIVSEELRKILEGSGINGVRFIKEKKR